MVVVESYSMAVVLCFVTMLCWGSWANTQKLTSREWPFPLFYWDYTIGVLLLALIMALTMGSMGTGGRSFIPDLRQATGHNIGLALLGGVIFNLSNLLFVGAIEIAGLAVAFPVAIGLALVIGVIANYVAAPVGSAPILFAGVACIVAAILIDAYAYSRLPSSGQKTIGKGFIYSIAAGVLMGFFYRFVAASMSTGFVNLEAGKLSPYSAVAFFAAGVFLSNFIWNSIVMAKPFVGASVTYKDYFVKGNSRLHLIGILGGIIWCIGMSLSIIASGSAGFAISYGLGQGATMVAAFWGVFIWKEFHAAPKGTNKLIALMFLFYIVGLALIIAAKIV